MIFRAFLVLLLAPLLGLIIVAGRWGLADLHSLDPQSAMGSWEQAGSMDDEARWDRALRSASKASSLDSGNADYYFYTGKLWEWKAMTSPVWSRNSRESRKHSIEQYKTVLEKRPAWSLAWISLAQSKLWAQEMDETAFIALENALVNSPWDPRILFKSVWIGMSVWDQLPVERKNIIRGAIERLLTKKPWAKKIIPMAVSQYKEKIFEGVKMGQWPSRHIERMLADRDKADRKQNRDKQG